MQRIAVWVAFLLLLVGCGETAVPQAWLRSTAVPPTPAPNCEGVIAAPDAGPPQQYGARVVNSYPHDPTAFTQGLQFVDGVFFEGTGKYGASDVRRVVPETGEVLQARRLSDDYFGEGITLMNGRLYQLTWKAQTAFVYNPADLSLQETLSYQTQGWGLTHNGRCLIMSDGSSTLTFRDPDTFVVLGQLPVFDGDEPVVNLNELEFIDGNIYANVWLTDLIAIISPQSGQVEGWIDLTPLADDVRANNANVDVLNGIAYDAAEDRLFVTGKYWPVLYQIELTLVE